MGARARQLQARRLWTIALSGTAVAGFVIVILNTFQENLMFYITPSQVWAFISQQSTLIWDLIFHRRSRERGATREVTLVNGVVCVSDKCKGLGFVCERTRLDLFVCSEKWPLNLCLTYAGFGEIFP